MYITDIYIFPLFLLYVFIDYCWIIVKMYKYSFQSKHRLNCRAIN